MEKFRKIPGLFLILVYAFLFASTNLFYHTHLLAEHKLVHSHPFSVPGHSHTASQILLIDTIASADFLESDELPVSDRLPQAADFSVARSRDNSVQLKNNQNEKDILCR